MFNAPAILLGLALQHLPPGCHNNNFSAIFSSALPNVSFVLVKSFCGLLLRADVGLFCRYYPFC